MCLPDYQPHRDRETRINSAKMAAESIVRLDLYPAHKKELLSICIWKITEADGNLNTRYRSEQAIQRQMDGEAPRGRGLRHEHVFQQRYLIQRMIENNENPRDVLDDAIGCVVTEEEHNQLLHGQELDGWERYRQAGITVIDLETRQPLEW